MKTIILIPSLRGGGAEFVAGEWAKELIRRNGDVTVVLTHPKSGDEAGLVGGRTVYIPRGGFIRQIYGLMRILRRERPDAIIALMPYWNLLAIMARGLLRKSETAVIISARNMVLPLMEVHGKAFRLKHYLAKVFYRNCDAFVSISHPVAAENSALYGVPISSTFVVPNPAAAKLASHPNLGSSRDGSDHSAPDLTIVVPARLVAQKRPRAAIDTAVELREKYEVSSRVLYYGNGPLKAELEAYAMQVGVTCSFAWASDWFYRCPERSIVLLPSLSEGFGNVLVEAAGAGIPSVASSQCLGVSDAIVPGITGVLVNGAEPADFASGILAISTQVKREHVASWLERFSVVSSADQLLKAINFGSEARHAKVRSARTASRG